MANKLRTRLSAERERTRFLPDTKGSRNNVVDPRHAKALACRESQSARGLRLMTMTVYPLLNNPSTMRTFGSGD